MFPDVSELIRVMNKVVEELQNTQELMRENTQAVDNLTKALEA